MNTWIIEYMEPIEASIWKPEDIPDTIPLKRFTIDLDALKAIQYNLLHRCRNLLNREKLLFTIGVELKDIIVEGALPEYPLDLGLPHEYFQTIYDPEIRNTRLGFIEPGERLKHGRYSTVIGIRL